jgi:hypothetical protein
MDRRLEVEQLRRSIAMLRPGARDAVGREDVLHLLAELGDVQGRLDNLKRRLRERRDAAHPAGCLNSSSAEVDGL